MDTEKSLPGILFNNWNILKITSDAFSSPLWLFLLSYSLMYFFLKNSTINLMFPTSNKGKYILKKEEQTIISEKSYWINNSSL